LAGLKRSEGWGNLGLGEVGEALGKFLFGGKKNRDRLWRKKEDAAESTRGVDWG